MLRPSQARAQSAVERQPRPNQRTDEELASAFAVDRNIFIITGQISRLAVLDCDDQVAIEYWRKRLGDVLDETAHVATGRGRHFYLGCLRARLTKGAQARAATAASGIYAQTVAGS